MARLALEAVLEIAKVDISKVKGELQKLTQKVSLDVDEKKIKTQLEEIIKKPLAIRIVLDKASFQAVKAQLQGLKTDIKAQVTPPSGPRPLAGGPAQPSIQPLSGASVKSFQSLKKEAAELQGIIRELGSKALPVVKAQLDRLKEALKKSGLEGLNLLKVEKEIAKVERSLLRSVDERLKGVKGLEAGSRKQLSLEQKQAGLREKAVRQFQAAQERLSAQQAKDATKEQARQERLSTTRLGLIKKFLTVQDRQIEKSRTFLGIVRDQVKSLGQITGATNRAGIAQSKLSQGIRDAKLQNDLLAKSSFRTAKNFALSLPPGKKRVEILQKINLAEKQHAASIIKSNAQIQKGIQLENKRADAAKRAQRGALGGRPDAFAPPTGIKAIEDATKQSQKLKQLQARLAGLRGSATQATGALSSMGNAAIASSTALGGPLARSLGIAGQGAKTFGLAIAFAGVRLAAFTIAIRLIFGLQRALGDAVRSVIKFESALADTNKIFRISNAEIQDFGKQQVQLAIQFGQTVSAVQEVGTEFARQGLTVNEVLKATAASLLAVNAAGVTTTAAMELLTVVVNSFGKSFDQAEQIIDIFTFAADKTASSVQDLINIFQRSASAASESGFAIEDVVAVSALLRQTTRRTSQALGTSLRAIITFINTSSDTLDKLGVSITDQFGETRRLQNILGDLGKAFTNLTDTQKVNIATQIVGRRRVNEFLAAIKTSGEALNLANEATNAQGSAQAKAAIEIETTRAKLDQLGSSFENLVQQTAQLGFADLFRDTVDGIRTAFTFAGKFLDVLNKIPGLGAGITGTLTAVVIFKVALPFILKAVTGAKLYFSAVTSSAGAQQQNNTLLQQQIGLLQTQLGLQTQIAAKTALRGEILAPQVAGAAVTPGGALAGLLPRRGVLDRSFKQVEVRATQTFGVIRQGANSAALSFTKIGTAGSIAFKKISTFALSSLRAIGGQVKTLGIIIGFSLGAALSTFGQDLKKTNNTLGNLVSSAGQGLQFAVLGSFLGPIGAAVGFLSGTVLGFIQNWIGDNKKAEESLRKLKEEASGTFGKIIELQKKIAEADSQEDIEKAREREKVLLDEIRDRFFKLAKERAIVKGPLDEEQVNIAQGIAEASAILTQEIIKAAEAHGDLTDTEAKELSNLIKIKGVNQETIAILSKQSTILKNNLNVISKSAKADAERLRLALAQQQAILNVGKQLRKLRDLEESRERIRVVANLQKQLDLVINLGKIENIRFQSLSNVAKTSASINKFLSDQKNTEDAIGSKLDFVNSILEKRTGIHLDINTIQDEGVEGIREWIKQQGNLLEAEGLGKEVFDKTLPVIKEILDTIKDSAKEQIKILKTSQDRLNNTKKILQATEEEVSLQKQNIIINLQRAEIESQLVRLKLRESIISDQFGLQSLKLSQDRLKLEIRLLTTRSKLEKLPLIRKQENLEEEISEVIKKAEKGLNKLAPTINAAIFNKLRFSDIGSAIGSEAIAAIRPLAEEITKALEGGDFDIRKIEEKLKAIDDVARKRLEGGSLGKTEFVGLIAITSGLRASINEAKIAQIEISKIDKQISLIDRKLQISVETKQLETALKIFLDTTKSFSDQTNKTIERLSKFAIKGIDFKLSLEELRRGGVTLAQDQIAIARERALVQEAAALEKVNSIIALLGSGSDEARTAQENYNNVVLTGIEAQLQAQLDASRQQIEAAKTAGAAFLSFNREQRIGFVRNIAIGQSLFANVKNTEEAVKRAQEILGRGERGREVLTRVLDALKTLRGTGRTVGGVATEQLEAAIKLAANGQVTATESFEQISTDLNQKRNQILQKILQAFAARAVQAGVPEVTLDPLAAITNLIGLKDVTVNLNVQKDIVEALRKVADKLAEREKARLEAAGGGEFVALIEQGASVVDALNKAAEDSAKSNRALQEAIQKASETTGESLEKSSEKVADNIANAVANRIVERITESEVSLALSEEDRNLIKGLSGGVKGEFTLNLPPPADREFTVHIEATNLVAAITNGISELVTEEELRIILERVNESLGGVLDIEGVTS